MEKILKERERIGDFKEKDKKEGEMVNEEGRKIKNIVMMGMGEKIYNLEEVKKEMMIE